MVPGQIHLPPGRLRERQPANGAPLVGYVVALVSVAAGLALLTRLWRSGAPGAADSAFGVVLVLLGINRYIVTRMRSRPRRRRSWENDADA